LINSQKEPIEILFESNRAYLQNFLFHQCAAMINQVLAS
jgi:hypothetical protein